MPDGTPRRRSASDQPGASNTSAPVASTDNANPGSPPSAGSTDSRTSTAAHSAGTADRWRPSTNASRATDPITAARSTLGDGRHNTTKPTSTAPASANTPRGPNRASRASPSTAPHKIA